MAQADKAKMVGMRTPNQDMITGKNKSESAKVENKMTRKKLLSQRIQSSISIIRGLLIPGAVNDERNTRTMKAVKPAPGTMLSAARQACVKSADGKGSLRISNQIGVANRGLMVSRAAMRSNLLLALLNAKYFPSKRMPMRVGMVITWMYSSLDIGMGISISPRPQILQ